MERSGPGPMRQRRGARNRKCGAPWAVHFAAFVAPGSYFDRQKKEREEEKSSTLRSK